MQKIGYQWFDIDALLMIVLLNLLKRISFNYMSLTIFLVLKFKKSGGVR